MSAVETGRHHTSYRSELRLWHTRPQFVRMAVLAVIVLTLPLLLDNYWLSLANTAMIAAIGAIGLNILVGYTGQISLGQGGFLAVGAFTSAILTDRLGMPAPVSIVGAVLLTAAVGVIVGLPALRLKGLYLAIATLASQMVILFIVRRWGFLTEGQGFLDVARLEVFGFRLDRASFEQQWYMILLVITVLAALTATNLFRTGMGRSFMAVRDQDHRGVRDGRQPHPCEARPSCRTDVGLAGALLAHYTEILSWEKFTIDVSILYLAMIIVGGLGSVAGAVYGAVFMTVLPVVVRSIADVVGGAVPIIKNQLPAVEHGVFGLTIIVFLIFEPRGLNRIWQRIKDWFGFWPFRD